MYFCWIDPLNITDSFVSFTSLCVKVYFIWFYDGYSCFIYLLINLFIFVSVNMEYLFILLISVSVLVKCVFSGHQIYGPWFLIQSIYNFSLENLGHLHSGLLMSSYLVLPPHFFPINIPVVLLCTSFVGHFTYHHVLSWCYVCFSMQHIP